MANATSAANVVANLETNQWSFNHLDLVVHNTGNGPAFDVAISFSPELPYDTESQKSQPPFGLISILRPGQIITTGVARYAEVYKDSYTVTVRWKASPKSKRSEEVSYAINIAALGAVTRLGASSPGVQIAEQIKKIREDWQAVAQGNRKLAIDAYNKGDREAIAAERKEYHEPVKASIKKEGSGKET